jgi:hypothetical protein
MSSILSIPSILRYIVESLRSNTWPGPLSQFLSILIGSLIPIASMLYSLLNAIRQKQAAMNVEGEIAAFISQEEYAYGKGSTSTYDRSTNSFQRYIRKLT